MRDYLLNRAMWWEIALGILVGGILLDVAHRLGL